MYGTVKLNNGSFIWSCQDCAALVADRDRHDMWHVNVIGGLTSASDRFTRGDDSYAGRHRSCARHVGRVDLICPVCRPPIESAQQP